MAEQILIVEDDQDMNRGLCAALRANDRRTLACQSLEEARWQLRIGVPSLVLLDENLPDGSGLELLREIREEHAELPVILLTAKDTDMDIVEGLEAGADDYVTKPFSLSVLRARVNTQLRKSSERAASASYCCGSFRFDFEAMRFETDGQTAELSKTEQKLLWILIQNAGNIVPREVLLDRIWTDAGDYVDENALSVTVKRLRDKLGAQKQIKTVYGVGYSWSKE